MNDIGLVGDFVNDNELIDANSEKDEYINNISEPIDNTILDNS